MPVSVGFVIWPLCVVASVQLLGHNRPRAPPCCLSVAIHEAISCEHYRAGGEKLVSLGRGGGGGGGGGLPTAHEAGPSSPLAGVAVEQEDESRGFQEN